MFRKGLPALALLAATAAAHADATRGMEFGLGVTRNDFTLDRDYFGAELKDRTTGYSALVGYRFMPQLAVEGHYFDGGEAEWSVPGVRLSLKSKAYGASVLGTLPIGDSFGIFGRVGYLHGELETRASIDGDLFGEDTKDNKAFYGIGIRTMMEGAQVRLEYNKADFDIVDTQQYQLSVVWLF
jgi:OmpA-OmpF porin, OOP family